MTAPTTDPCTVCKRIPERCNNDLAECSHVDCPHRRHCWSDGTGDHQSGPRPKSRDAFAPLFEKVGD